MKLILNHYIVPKDQIYNKNSKHLFESLVLKKQDNGRERKEKKG